MYGLRAAPAIWQEVVKKLMRDLNFQPNATMPCVYYDAATDVMIVAHVDDFLSCGSLEALTTLRQELRQRYDCDGDILGPAEGEKLEIKLSGRQIKWTPGGLEWRGDPKLIATYIQRAGMVEGSGVDTPGVKKDKEVPLDEPELGTEEATIHRGLVALANSIAQDRPDLGFATLDLFTTMARPRESDRLGPKRLARYLCRHPECVLEHHWQAEPPGLRGLSDGDWGSCWKTRRSVSG